MIIFFMLVDTLFTQCALKCDKMCNTDDVIKCRKYTTQMISSYGRESRNDQSNRRIDKIGFLHVLLRLPGNNNKNLIISPEP